MNKDVTEGASVSSLPDETAADLTPKTLVLDLLAVAGEIALSTPALTLGGELMGFTPGAIRVAITRLSADNLIESPSRGEWRLVTDTPWARERTRWQQLDQLVRPWDGGWWVVATQRLPRSNRPVWRRHERALLHRGFREVARDLFLRPDNLALDFDALLEQLLGLGMHPESLVFTARELSFQPEPALWQTLDRQQALERAQQEMQNLLRERGSGCLDTRCRRFLETGRRATRALNADPLLPEELVGLAPRSEVAALLPRFVAAGRSLWLERLGARTAE